MLTHPLYFDVVTGVPGSQRVAFSLAYARALTASVSLAFPLLSAVFPSNEMSARDQAQRSFNNYALPYLEENTHVILVTDLCRDIAQAGGLIFEMAEALTEQIKSGKIKKPVLMDCIHMRADYTECVQTLHVRGSLQEEQLLGLGVQSRIFGINGPCYAQDRDMNYQTIVLDPQHPDIDTTKDMVERVLMAKAMGTGRLIEPASSQKIDVEAEKKAVRSAPTLPSGTKRPSVSGESLLTQHC